MAVIKAQYATLTFNSEVVGGIVSITGIDAGETSEIDVTTLASTRKEYVQGLADSGTLEIELIRDYADEGQIALEEARDGQETETAVITFNTTPSTILTFQAFVKNFGVDAGADDVLRARVSLRVTGAIVRTAGGGGG